MIRKLKRIQIGFKYYFSTQQQQQQQQQYQFSFQDSAKGSSFKGDDQPNFEFKNEQDPLNNNQKSQNDGQYSEISLPPFANSSDDDDEKNKENQIHFDGEEDQNKEESLQNQKYDVAIIGGGSGGLAFALEAHKLGLKTILFDFVEPTKRGSRWGIGGTCVNVGCIPKKLFHTASLISDSLLKQFDFGFGKKELSLDLNSQNEQKKKIALNFRWRQLVENVQNYIGDINLGFEAQLMNRNIPYVNALATLGDKNTVFYTNNQSLLYEAVANQDFTNLKANQIKADYIVIAVGGRPQFLKDCINSEEYSISSDDLFQLKKPPGKTLVVGGGYVALECAGFLSNLGMNTTVMTRGQYLRDFDSDIVQMIIDDMKLFNNVQFIDTSLPYKIEKNIKSANYSVCYRNLKTAEESCDLFDTILQAVGRKPNTSALNLKSVGVKVHSETNKIIGGNSGDSEKTSVNNIFSLGDVLQGVPELTPPAQMAGRLLAHRISGLKKQNMKYYQEHKMDYNSIATTVFTPQEYSCVGLNEEQAIKQFGQDNIEVYHSRFTPLEEQLTFNYDHQNNIIKRKGYCKVICDKQNNNKILGLHYFGPNAGEVMQGYALAFKMNLYKHQLDSIVGIHPTSAEELINLQITKSSGENFDKDTC